MEDDLDIDHDHPQARSSAARRAYPKPLPEGMKKFLCEHCQSFSLQPADFVGYRDSLRVNNENEYFDLGTTQSIIARSDRCTLCRLVVHCLDLRNPKTPIRNRDGSYTTVRLRWHGGSKRWNRFLGIDETPNFLKPSMYTFNNDEENYKKSPRSSCKLVPCGDDMWTMGVQSTTFYARLPAPTQAYFEMIKHWLAQCAKLHGFECNRSMLPAPRTGSPQQPLMVIDVQRGCLVDILPSRRYFALSYVWGRDPTFQTLKSNVGHLRQLGGIKDIQHMLPKTIVDAMDLLVAIGEIYLWCDRLCIVQDDARKHVLISRMDEIYGSAYAVIIARSGEHADVGLFGLHPWHKEERVSDTMRLVAVPDYAIDKVFGMAPIEDRAWTFQEQLLSRRALIFTKGLASFQCSKAIWRQDVILEEVEDRSGPDTDWGFLYHDLVDYLTREPVHGYANCREAYSIRKLTFPSDALDAFSGISRTIASRLGSQLHFGLPVALFDWAMLWTTSIESTRCNDLPTWSWTAWTGRKGPTLGSVADLLLNQSWILWYYDDPDVGIVRPLRDLEVPAGIICPPLSQMKATRTRNYDYYAAALRRWNMTLPRRETTPVSPNRFRRYCSGFLETRVDPFPASSSVPLEVGTLRFYTMCATFEVAQITVTRPYGETTVNSIRDKYSIPCGTVMDYISSSEHLPLSLMGRQDVIVLSERFNENEEDLYLRNLQGTGIECIPSGTVCKEFNVMIVDWVDGWALRKGIGTVCQIALEFAIEGPVWREVVLR